MSSSQRLHPTAAAMYRYIIRFKLMNAGDSPTRREIAAAVGVPSVSIVQHHLNALESAGMITRPKRGAARRIAIPGAVWRYDAAAAAGVNKCAIGSPGEDVAPLEEEKRMGEGWDHSPLPGE